METILTLDSIDQFLSSLSANGMSKNTTRAYRADLMGLLEGMDPPATDDPKDFERVVLEYIADQRVGWADSTLKRKLACFRSFGRSHEWDWFLARYKQPVLAAGIAHPIPEGVEGVIRMIECSKKPVHKAVITLTGLCGLRVGEALEIRPSMIDEDSMTMKVHGKGNKTRTIPIDDFAYQQLLPVLLRCWKNNDLLVPLHERSARRAIKSAAVKAGLSRPVASHDMRMTFGTVAYYNSGGDIRAVQELLGHSSSHTTENYTQVSMDKMRAAANIVKVTDK